MVLFSGWLRGGERGGRAGGGYSKKAGKVKVKNKKVLSLLSGFLGHGALAFGGELGSTEG